MNLIPKKSNLDLPNYLHFPLFSWLPVFPAVLRALHHRPPNDPFARLNSTWVKATQKKLILAGHSIKWIHIMYRLQYPSMVFGLLLCVVLACSKSQGKPKSSNWFSLNDLFRNINEKISIPSTDSQYVMKFNTAGDQLVIYTRDFVEVIQLQVKKETQVSYSLSYNL